MKSLLLKGLRHKFWKGKIVCIKERFSPIQGCKKLVDFVRSIYRFLYYTVGECYFFSKHLVPDSETQYSIIVCFSSSGKVLLIMKERFSHFMGVGNFINIVRINTDYRSIDDRPLKR